MKSTENTFNSAALIEKQNLMKNATTRPFSPAPPAAAAAAAREHAEMFDFVDRSNFN